MEEIIELDKKLLVFLNSLHTPWLDPIMLYVTQTYIWVPLYLFLIFLVLKDYRADSWVVLIGAFITIILADQITSSVMKPYFARLRPSREPSLAGMLHIVNGYIGGQFGFASSHAANTFGAATFFWLLFKARRKWIVVLFLWASIMTYSRIYLGVHYPGDIIVGMLVGILCAFAGFNTYKLLEKKFIKKELSQSGTQ